MNKYNLIKKGQSNKLTVRINNEINCPEVRLTGDNITPAIYSTSDALSISRQMGLDLIEIAPNAKPPVCRVIALDKYLYEQKKAKKDQDKRNKANAIEVKELRFTPNIDEHDINFKVNHAINFLKEGNKVKVVMFFSGRELLFKDKGQLVLLKIAEKLADVGIAENVPKFEGEKRMFMIFKPKK